MSDSLPQSWFADLAELCAIPSVAAEGVAIEPAAGWLRARLERLGASVTRIDGSGAPILYAELGPAEAPRTLLRLGDDLPDRPVAEYKRRIGPWLLWRAGPAKGGHARYLAIHVETPESACGPCTLTTRTGVRFSGDP